MTQSGNGKSHFAGRSNRHAGCTFESNGLEATAANGLAVEVVELAESLAAALTAAIRLLASPDAIRLGACIRGRDTYSSPLEPHYVSGDQPWRA